jgi:Na+/melibiose symporter-like transporter
MSAWRLAAFAAPSIPVAAMLMPVTVYLPNYYARDLGLSWAAIAFAFSAVRLFDLWLDPTLGFLIDKTNSRFGRYRPWLVAGLPMAVLAVWMLFMAGEGVTGGQILLWLVVGFVGQSMASMAHVAWASKITPDYRERSRVYAWLQAFNVIGILLALGMPPLAADLLGLDHVAGVQAIGWLVMLLLPVTVTIALLVVREPPPQVNHSPPHWRQYLSLLRRGSVLRIIATDIVLGTGPVLAGTLFFDYFFALRGYERADAGKLLLLYFVGGLLAAPFWSWLSHRMSKHKALVIAALAYAVAQASVVIAPHGIWWGVVTMTLAGIPFTAGSILLRAMMADVADQERLESGVDRSGLLFGLLSGTVKIGSASAVALAGVMLTWAGFQSDLGPQNAQSALTALEMTFALIPAALGVIAAAIIWGHKLDADTHAEIRRRLALRDMDHEPPSAL